MIRPGALLLTTEGETANLTAEVLDAAGNTIEAEVTWSSSDPQLVSVNPEGEVTVTGPLGTAQVTATAKGVTAFPATVVVAKPVDGAILLHDEDVISASVGVEGTSDPVRQRIVLRPEVDPQPGDVIIGAEELTIGGVIETVIPNDGGTEVVYRPLPPQELFEQLIVDVDVDASTAPVVPVGELADDVTLHVEAPGVTSASLREGLDGKFLTCKGEATYASITGLNTTIENGIHFRLHFSDGVADPEPTLLLVTGKLVQKISSGLSIKAGYTGTYTCKADLFNIPLPISGVAALVAKPVIPIGVVGSVSGSITAAGLTVTVESTDGLELDAGFTYDPTDGFDLHDGFDRIHEGPNLVLDLVTPAGYRVGASGFVGLASGVGLDILGREEPLGIVQAQVGVQQSFDLASPEAQAASAAYASAYDLSLLANVGIGTDLKDVLSWLGIGISAQGAQIQASQPWSKSPTGKLTASATSASPGEQVHLHVKLDAENLTYLTHYNVSKIEIYRAFGSEEPTLFRTIELSQSNQSDFDTVWDTTGEEGGDYHFYAFVVDDLLAKVAEVPLEVDGNSEVIVQLGGACMAGLTEAITQASACSGTTTEDYQQGPEGNGIAIERHTAGSGLVWEQDSENPLMFNLTEATVTWTEEIEYTGSQPCFITSSGTGERVANTDPEAGAYVSGVIIVQEDGTYFGTGYVFMPDVADDGCFGGGRADVTVPLFTTGSNPTLQSDGSGGSYLVGSSDFTTPVGGVGTDTWSFHFPDLPPR
ncbi:MAG TPA: Ig-like domain-containing protein [Trueperaceae bacterium]